METIARVRKFTITEDGDIARSHYCDTENFNGVKDTALANPSESFKQEILETAHISVGEIIAHMNNNIPGQIGETAIRPMVKVRLKDNGFVRFQLFLFDRDKVSEEAMLKEKYNGRPRELAVFTRYMRQFDFPVKAGEEARWINDGSNTLLSNNLSKKQVYPFAFNFFQDVKNTLGISREKIPVQKDDILNMTKYGFLPDQNSWKNISDILVQRINFWANPTNDITVMNEHVSAADVIFMRTIAQRTNPKSLIELIEYEDKKFHRPLGRILIKGDFTEDYAYYKERSQNENWDCVMVFDNKNSTQANRFDTYTTKRFKTVYEEAMENGREVTDVLPIVPLQKLNLPTNRL